MTSPPSFLSVPVPSKNCTDRSASPTILVIEDEPVIRRVICCALEAHGYTVEAPPVETEAGTALAKQAAFLDRYNLLLVDLKLPFLDGLQFIKRLRSKEIGTPIMVVAGFTPPPLRSRLANLDVSQILDKPFELSCLLETVQRALTNMGYSV